MFIKIILQADALIKATLITSQFVDHIAVCSLVGQLHHNLTNQRSNDGYNPPIIRFKHYEAALLIHHQALDNIRELPAQLGHGPPKLITPPAHFHSSKHSNIIEQ